MSFGKFFGYDCDFSQVARVIIIVFTYQIIERILEFSRHQITDIMCAYDPSYRALHRPNENGALEG